MSYLGSSGIAWAQTGSLIPPPSRSKPLELPDPSLPELSSPRRVLPPAPPSRRRTATPLAQVRVKEIIVTGSTVFAPAELAAVTEPYVGHPITSEQLEVLRLALTQLYLNHGYINSGATLPDQTVADGVIHFEVIEGELTEVILSDNRWFRDSYLRKRLTLGVGKPLRLGVLQERLQLLRQDERIVRFQAQLRPGVQLGQSELHVRVGEALPFTFDLEFNNHQSPAVGAERGQLTLAHRNVTGYGDRLQITVAGSSGDNARLDARYAVPLNRYDTILSLQYRRSRSLVIEAPFDPLNIEGRSEIYTVTLRHPIYRTLQRDVAIALSGEHLSSQTSLFGGIGESAITAFRLSAEWTERTANQVIAVRSRLSLGVDLLGATIETAPDNPTTPRDESTIAVPSGRFLSWLGQVQWVRRLQPRDVELLFRLDVQISKDPLLSLEQMAIGGRFSVRGYRENQIVRDQGLLISLEARFPLVRRKPWAEFIQLVPFVDVGWGENRKVFTPRPKVLASVGVGVRWAARWTVGVPLRSQAELFWGYKLIDKDIRNPGGNLQDKGLHMQLVLSSF